VIAGDSLARQAATAEAAARRAAIDSAARSLNDSVGRNAARTDSMVRAIGAASPPVDPAIARARRDSALARARRDSVRRAAAARASTDTAGPIIPGAPVRPRPRDTTAGARP
jgi:hypothetical protein